MPRIDELEDIGNQAIESTNLFFHRTNSPLSIHRMTESDVRWCNSRSMMSENHLAWLSIKDGLHREDSYSFCFKLQDGVVPDRPEGGCVCSFSIHNGIMTVEMIQNFDLDDGALSGRMMELSQIAILFFMLKAEGTGVYIENPVNDQVRDYYVDVCGYDYANDEGTLLYRSVEDILNGYQELQPGAE
ncbi:hypothetical protein [Brenneria tiliae]|uniref:hypothetical protein n=1 Tax=Brenneria tiliae TaxID=2914984 RepID=UPI0020149112|nr:hypothetical protein [Brenneria tiliae]MCL2899849.1 hypothetical protein [Brenneria tiliae]MCL2904662.1 hypothetical protein [Brenneria tiliae]